MITVCQRKNKSCSQPPNSAGSPSITNSELPSGPAERMTILTTIHPKCKPSGAYNDFVLAKA